MRIVGGSRKGLQILCPSGDSVRPTTDLMRESLFNILGQQLKDLTFLDLFSGTGAVAIEAASRGARVMAVENHRLAVRYLRKNIQNSTLPIEMSNMDALSFLQSTTQQYDIIFADPPYDANYYQPILEIVSRQRLLSDIGVLILEHRSLEEVRGIAPLTMYKSRKYGNKMFSFLQIESELV